MSGKAVVSLTTGLEDPEQVTVAMLVAVREMPEPTTATLPVAEPVRLRVMFEGDRVLVLKLALL